MAIAIQTGNRFRFPDSKEIYQFASITFEGDTPIVNCWDRHNRPVSRKGFHLSDLIRSGENKATSLALFNWAEAGVRFLIGVSNVYTLNGPREVYIEARNGEFQRWVVIIDKRVLGKDGEWYREPLPSDRSEAFINLTRFDSKEQALLIYQNIELSFKGEALPLYYKEFEG